MCPYQVIFEPLALDMKLHRRGAGTRAGTGTGTVAAGAEVVAAAAAAAATSSTVGAAVVLRPADLIDGDTAKASTPQGKPPATGVIPSHDHCSHTCITVTVEWKRGEVGRRMKRLEGRDEGRSQGKSKKKKMV